jgi:hypothetical protein
VARTITVTVLNDGRKYVAIDLKYIPRGGSCWMDNDATIVRAGPGGNRAYTSAIPPHR